MSDRPASIEERLRAYLSKPGFPAPDDDTPLAESGFVPSLELLELVTFIEDSFGVELEPGDVRGENLDSISRLAQLIRSRSVAREDAAS
jgi:acyl carrier protein